MAHLWHWEEQLREQKPGAGCGRNVPSSKFAFEVKDIPGLKSADSDD